VVILRFKIPSRHGRAPHVHVPREHARRHRPHARVGPLALPASHTDKVDVISNRLPIGSFLAPRLSWLYRVSSS